MNDVTNKVFANTGEQREDNHVVVQSEVWSHGLVPVGFQNTLLMIGNVNASIYQVRKVKRFEGIEFVGTLFCRTVAT